MQSHTEIAVASIKCFTDDGTLDLKELEYLMGLAQRDGVIDDEEKRVLSNIFGKISQVDVSTEVWTQIGQIKQQYDIN